MCNCGLMTVTSINVTQFILLFDSTKLILRCVGVQLIAKHAVPDKKERKEIESLKATIAKLKADATKKDTRARLAEKRYRYSCAIRSSINFV